MLQLRRGVGFVSVLVATLVASIAAAPAHAAFPGANGLIAFDAFDGNDQEIYTINPDGTGLMPLTSTNAYEFEPAWSPDGSRIVFTRTTNFATYELWTMNADGSGQAPVPGGSGDELRSPAFTADASRIIFSQFDGMFFLIWGIPAGGGTQQPLSTGGGEGDFEPTAFPGGDVIAFYRDFLDTSSGIMTMAGGGGMATRLTPDTIRAEGPNYSPDATQLTFARCEAIGEGCAVPFEIVRMGSGGGPITEVTSLPEISDTQHVDPVFSPDGTLIAFARMTSFSPDGIFTVAATGGTPQAVTPSSLPSASNPDWQPTRSSTTSCYGRTATIVGNGEDNKIIGTPGDDVIKGRKGDDVIKGKKGDDVLCGQRGDDRLFGGRGDDILIGGKGSDFLKGGPGKDQIFGGTPDAKNQPRVEDICVFSEEDKTNNCKRPD